MELPIAPQSYRPSVEAQVRAVKRARIIKARTTCTETPLQGATAYINTQRPGVREANFAAEVHGGSDADPRDDAAGPALLDELLTHFADAGVTCWSLACPDTAWPPGLTDAATERGYRPVNHTAFLLEGYAAPAKPNQELQIIPARAAYRDLPAFFTAMAIEDRGADKLLAAALARTWIDCLDEPRLELFLGRIAGEPVGVAGVLTLGQIGVIEPAYTAAAARGRGVAAALIDHTLEHCRRAAMAQVLLERTERCSSTGFYERIGFKPVATYTDLVLR